MCKPFREYLGVVREYKSELVMLIGFGLTVGIYVDFRTFIADTTRVQTQQTEVLRTIETRLTSIEQHQP